MTAEQLEASRAERMRQDGHGALTLEDARTWLEETGLCPFAPRKQFSTFTTPSFVEAVAGHHNQNPDAKHMALAENLLVRLERDDVAVRLNLLGQPGEQPDYVVASWVLPYVYALRGDRDWRRNPQLTGSRQVSPLAVEAYKLLEAGDATIPTLKHALGREVSEAAVVRAVTELWQQLRIIPVIKAPGEPVYWQLLRVRFQKAIAEGASTSQVTAISVLASIYLQAVIAASMEEVELFLSPLTARSKIREVLRGLLATRQVHTIQLGHAPHFYVAGTLPEFATPATTYASAAMASSSYFTQTWDHHDHYDRYGHFERMERTPEPPSPPPAQAAERHGHHQASNGHQAANGKSASNGKSPAPHSRFNRPAARSRDRKPAQSSSGSRPARRSASEARKPASRQTAARTASKKTGTRWASGAKTEHGKRNGVHKTNSSGNHAHSNGVHKTNSSGNRAHSNGNGARVTRSANGKAVSHDRNARPSRSASGKSVSRDRNASRSTWSKHNGHSSRSSKPASTSKAVSRTSSSARKNVKTDARSRKPVLTAGAKAGNSRRYGFTAPAKPRTKKRG